MAVVCEWDSIFIFHRLFFLELYGKRVRYGIELKVGAKKYSAYKACYPIEKKLQEHGLQAQEERWIANQKAISVK